MFHCTPLLREAPFQLKMHKTHQLRTTFGSWAGKKWQAAVARSKFSTQNAPKKHNGRTTVRMSKNGRTLWREACLQVKVLNNMRGPLGQTAKSIRVRATFGSEDVKNWHATDVRSTSSSQNAQNTSGIIFGGSIVR